MSTSFAERAALVDLIHKHIQAGLDWSWKYDPALEINYTENEIAEYQYNRARAEAWLYRTGYALVGGLDAIGENPRDVIRLLTLITYGKYKKVRSLWPELHAWLENLALRLGHDTGEGLAGVAADNRVSPSSATGAGDGSPREAQPNSSELTKVEKAMQIYLRDTNQSEREIARQVGCHPSLLSRSKRFQSLKEMYEREYRNKIPRGSKTMEGGMEAEDS
jgi:hypothetical protein